MPAGATESWHPADDGARLRTIHWAPGAGGRSDAPGWGRRILFCGGKRDFIERHAESYHRMLARGCAVAAADWRDQGLSTRQSCASRELFRHMETDLSRLLPWASETLGGPVVMMGHSMGGHMALRTLAARPDLCSHVSHLVLMAPMLGIAGPMPDWILRPLAHLQVRRGRGEAYPPGQIPYGPGYRDEVRRQRLTGDRIRFEEGFGWIEEEAGLAAGGATWGWLAAALDSIVKLKRPGTLEHITQPVLLLLGSEERVVDPAAIRTAAHRMPNASLRTIQNGHHELQLDIDTVQDEVWSAIWQFLDL